MTEHEQSERSKITGVGLRQANNALTHSIWQGGYAASVNDYQSGLQSLQAQYGLESEQVVSYRVYWGDACRDVVMSRSRLEKSLPGSGKNTHEESLDLLQEFCGTIPEFNESEMSKLYQKSTRIKFSLQLSEIERQGDVDTAIDFAQQFIKNSNDPFSLRAGLDYLQRIDVIAPPKDIWAQGNAERSNEIYRLARDNYICDLYSGCGADHPLVLKFCMENQCSMLADYGTLARRHLSPAGTPLFNWYSAIFQTLRN